MKYAISLSDGSSAGRCYYMGGTYQHGLQRYVHTSPDIKMAHKYRTVGLAKRTIDNYCFYDNFRGYNIEAIPD